MCVCVCVCVNKDKRFDIPLSLKIFSVLISLSEWHNSFNFTGDNLIKEKNFRWLLIYVNNICNLCDDLL